jgi:hypothetical protein
MSQSEDASYLGKFAQAAQIFKHSSTKDLEIHVSDLRTLRVLMLKSAFILTIGGLGLVRCLRESVSSASVKYQGVRECP